MSTRRCLAVEALRRRVIMSEIGSVISSLSKSQIPEPDTRVSANPPRVRDSGQGCGISPGAFGHARDVTLERQLAEAEAAHRELPHIRARAAAQPAAVPEPDLVLRRLGFFGNLR